MRCLLWGAVLAALVVVPLAAPAAASDVAVCNSGFADPELQVAACTSAIEADPGSRQLRFNRGLAWLDLDEPLGAIVDFNAAVEMAPWEPDPYERRSYTRWLLEDYAGSVEDLEQLVATVPGEPEALNYLAWALATAPAPYRDGRRALDYAREAVALENDAGYRDTLAAAFVALGAPEAAISEYEAVIRMDQAFVASYQEYLRERGYYAGPLDGDYGPATQRALEACVRDGCQLLADW